jgi:hypothetical protein
LKGKGRRINYARERERWKEKVQKNGQTKMNKRERQKEGMKNTNEEVKVERKISK